ncbi:unnamed protein product [Staurois parvus]|uniref:Olfactory receptor n=1 Tax=Staurois parvus TaxID=386267 RepID=A0ABN9HWJ3_9NEOB|nr:unnamed protein product [Staurois parvus]
MPKNDNRTSIIAAYFIIVGFETLREVELFLFSLFSTMYVFTISSHFMIVTLVSVDHHLHKPMYILLANFSMLEVLYTTVTVPKMLNALLTHHKEISSSSCLAQFYFLFGFGGAENCLLAVMAYDRYVAICRPLHYPNLMSGKTILKLALGAWVGGLLAAFPPTVWISTLRFCFPNFIDHFFCDYAPLLKLSCEDTSKVLIFTEGSLVALVPSLLTILSYIRITISILRIHSSSGRQKAFSTCGSHLAVFFLFSASAVSMYFKPSSASSPQKGKFVTLMYTALTPMFNPYIYCLRNSDVKTAVGNCCTIRTKVGRTPNNMFVEKYFVFVNSKISRLFNRIYTI